MLLFGGGVFSFGHRDFDYSLEDACSGQSDSCTA